MTMLFVGGAPDTHLPTQLNSFPVSVVFLRIQPLESDSLDLNLSTKRREEFFILCLLFHFSANLEQIERICDTVLLRRVNAKHLETSQHTVRAQYTAFWPFIIISFIIPVICTHLLMTELVPLFPDNDSKLARKQNLKYLVELVRSTS